MLSGQQTLGAINEALADLKRDEAEINARVEKSGRLLADLTTQEMKAYRELARFRLENSTLETVSTRLNDAQKSVSELLETRNKQMRRMKKRRDALEAECKALEAQRAQALEKQRVLNERFEDVVGQAEEELSSNTDFVARREEARRLAKTAAAAKDKAAQAKADRDAKGKDYENDALFMYLWERDFGTSSYNCTGVIRSLDRWVAKLVGFKDARANYAMLTEIPLRLSAHAQDCAEMAEKAEAGLEQTLALAVTRIAGEDLAALIDATDVQINDLTTRLEALEDEQDTLQAEESKFALGKDPQFLQAEDFLSEALKSADLRQLLRDALSTPSPDDEKIVRRLQDIEDQQLRLSTEMRQERELLRDVSRRKAEIERVARDFRRKQYDAGGSSFNNSGLGSVLLGELIKGAISGADYMAQANKSHRRPQTRRRHSSVAGGPFGEASSDSFGGGGFSSGESFGGGGFETGDRF